MSKLSCIVCNYDTHDSSKYNRHILTEKHIRNMKIYSICDLCNYFTENKVNYQRHLTTKKHLNNINMKNGIKYNQPNQKMEEKMEEIMNEIKKLKDLNEKNTNILKDTNNQNTQKIVKEARVIKKSVLTLLNTHFKDTPSIEYIKEEPFFKALEEEYNAKINDGSDKLFMRIFIDYEKKKLIKTLSDLILKFVKKDQQKFQSVFNIDSARFNFATKIDDFWMNDKKGIQLRKFTIDKVVDFMIDVLEVFRLRLVKLRKENIVKSTVENSDYLMINQKLLFEVVNYLNSPNTHTKIITHLSPNLRYDEQLLLLE